LPADGEIEPRTVVHKNPDQNRCEKRKEKNGKSRREKKAEAKYIGRLSGTAMTRLKN
jgi:hypothetical protein